MNRTDRALRALSAGNRILLHANEEGELLRDMCRVIVEMGGYRMAWVGYVEHDMRKTLRPMACAGDGIDLLEATRISWAETEHGHTTAATAVRTGHPCTGTEILAASEIPPHLGGEAPRHEIVPICSLPLQHDGDVFGILGILAAETEAFDEATLALLEDMADDFAFGIKTLRQRMAREKAEAQLLRVDRALRTLSAGNRTLLRANDEHELLTEMCRVIVEVGGYRMAWVGYAEHDDQKTIRPVAHQGFESGFLDTASFTWGDTERGQGACATAYRTDRPSVGRNIISDPMLAPWREEASKRGYASVSAFPLHVNGEPLGALAINAAEPDAFDDAEVALLSELADDLSFGIAAIRLRDKHREAEQRIRHMAYSDPLTGLPNRARLKEHLARAITCAKHEHQPFALLVLNIDRFRETNQVIGFRQGDRLLQELAERLQKWMAEDGLLAHLGVDSFALHVPHTDSEHACELAQTILHALEEPFGFSGIRVELRASIGIALFPGHGADPEFLILRADTAMKQAKGARTGFEVFRADTEQENLRRLALISDLRRGIGEDQLVLYCQPKVDLRTGIICGAEALVRWQHPEHGLLLPDCFIPLAERTGLIRPLTYWVLNEALGQCYSWHELGLKVPLAVNLSARDLVDPRLIDRITGMLTTWGANPDWLQLELTESALMEDPAAALEALKRLSNMGIKLYVDDFGTGYSSLSYLQKLPIDAIKIDKSFVYELTRSDESQVIVHSTIDLAHNLRLEAVAEGTATRDIWNRLITLGCDVAQGSYVGEPIPAGQIPDWCRHAAVDQLPN